VLEPCFDPEDLEAVRTAVALIRAVRRDDQDACGEGDRRRFVAVLHEGPVDSALKAVQASIVRESQELGKVDQNG
jgi:hypothetical protein